MPTISLDTDTLMTDIAEAVRGAVGDDVETMSDFSKDQLKSIADLTKMIAQGYANGELTDARAQAHLEDVKELTGNYVATLRGLSAVAAQQAWNAAAGVIRSAIETAVGRAIPWV